MSSIRSSLGVLAAAMCAFGIAVQYQSQTALKFTLGLSLVIPLAFGWLIYCSLQRRWRPIQILALLSAVAAGVTVLGYFFTAKIRHRSQDSAIATYQIQAAVEQFFFENPQRVFVNYEDVIGPQRYVKAARAHGGEDYHELFPLRADYEAMGVTMGDGRVNLVLRGASFVQHLPNGELRGNPESVRVYQALLSSRKDRKGVHVTSPFQGGRFETTWRGGVPEGRFRAYYADGKVWAEATYVHGVPSGRHVVYDRAGKIIYETVFVPWRRDS
jgi:hypothetical protein